MHLQSVEVCGDWEWQKEAFHLSLWNSKDMCCHWCVATKDESATSYADFSNDLPRRTHDDYISATDDPALARIVGFRSACLLWDYMHIVALGIMHIILGSLLMELCTEHVWGFATVRGKEVRVGLQLRHGYDEFLS